MEVPAQGSHLKYHCSRNGANSASLLEMVQVMGGQSELGREHSSTRRCIAWRRMLNIICKQDMSLC